MGSTDIFVSYSHHDKELLEELKLYLEPFQSSGQIVCWDDTQIRPGAKWRDEIKNALQQAKVALLLISQRFLASHFIADEELREILEAERNRGLTIFWIAVSASTYKHSLIEEFKAANNPERPLDSLTRPQLAAELVKIAENIHEALGDTEVSGQPEDRTAQTFSAQGGLTGSGRVTLRSPKAHRAPRTVSGRTQVESDSLPKKDTAEAFKRGLQPMIRSGHPVPQLVEISREVLLDRVGGLPAGEGQWRRYEIPPQDGPMNETNVTAETINLPSLATSYHTGTVVVTRPQPIFILHLSDMHITTNDDPLTRLQPLISDLTDQVGGLGVERLDYLVISGDLTNCADAEEFRRVRQIVSELITKFGLSKDRCIIVPGNHDVSWDQQVYSYRSARQVEVQRLTPGSFVQKDDIYLIRDETKYPLRFETFGKFYSELLRQPYPPKADDQCLPFLFAQTGLQFLALNSACEIDEFFPSRSRINAHALSNGLLKAEEQIEKAKHNGELAADIAVLRIAICHHPVTGNEKISDDAFLERLRQADVRLCLHGHVHEDRTEIVGYSHQRSINVIGAGSFGAVAKNRPESTPRLYNVIEIERDHSTIKVHTRCMRKEGGAWEGWAVWPGLTKHDKRTYYEVALSRVDPSGA